MNADDYLPVALVDDDESSHGQRVHGLRIYPAATLADLIDQFQAKGVLLAIPSASRRKRRQVLQRLSEHSVHVQTIPEFKDIVSGKARVDDISEVAVTDLLGRNTVPPVEKLLRGCITGKSVMITGAGGSIGSELCRQILELQPRRLVLLEISEPALYEIERELRQSLALSGDQTTVIPLLGSVVDGTRIREILEAFEVQTLYHAAAYKHVPIVEQNLTEGVKNNVFGTVRTARAAIECGVETFVLISTDKAVNPTSAMGATKRLAELALQAFQQETETTIFCMVRFGNVLESSGSVVPLFKEQIRAGGPVTVTHPEIIRYFMTIPEAAQLVIQSGSMASGGDVFLLDMGKPVRIEDLARRMINLMGLTVRDEGHPEGDIEIQYIGLRPAEKLYEELLIGTNAMGTEHPRIMRADEDSVTPDVLESLLEDLQNASDSARYDMVRDYLSQAVKEYSPNRGIDDILWNQKTGTTGVEGSSVVEFPRP